MGHSKFISTVTFTILLGGFSAFAKTGPSGSGGGKGVVCRNPDSTIASVQLLDLWEAENIRGYKINISQLPNGPVEKGSSDFVVMREHAPHAGPRSSAEATPSSSRLASDPFSTGPNHNLIDQAITKIQDSFDDRSHGVALDNQGPGVIKPLTGSAALAAQMHQIVLPFLNGSTLIHRQHGIALSLIDDSNEIETPNDSLRCKVEQIVTYLDSDPASSGHGEAFVNQDLVDKMDSVNQAALYTHEALYRVLRDWYGETNSVRTRRVVGFVFGGRSFTPLAQVLPTGFVKCYSNGGLNGISISEIDIARVAGRSIMPFYEVIPRMTFGYPVMGYGLPIETYDSRLLAQLTAGMFTAPNSPAFKPFEIYPLRGQGPVDYDHSYGTLIVDASSGQIKIYLSKELLPEATSNQMPDLSMAQQLSCSVQ